MIPYATSAFHFMHRNRTYYLPFLISTQYLPSSLRPYYTMWICFEVSICFCFSEISDLSAFWSPSHCLFHCPSCFRNLEGWLSSNFMTKYFYLSLTHFTSTCKSWILIVLSFLEAQTSLLELYSFKSSSKQSKSMVKRRSWDLKRKYGLRLHPTRSFHQKLCLDGHLQLCHLHNCRKVIHQGIINIYVKW